MVMVFSVGRIGPVTTTIRFSRVAKCRTCFSNLLQIPRLNCGACGLIHELKLAVAGWLHGNMNVLRMKLANIVNEMEKHIDDYPAYKESEAYKVKHFKHYQNGKDDTTYFFG